MGGVMHVWQTSRDKLWEIWNSTKAGLGLPDLPPVTCLSLADDCLVTGHARAMAHVVNSGAELEMQLQHSGLSSVPSGDVWIWRVDRANQTLELLSRMGCHTCSITSLVVMDPLTSNSWENHMRLTTVTIQGDIKMWAGPAESLELTASLPPHSDKVCRRRLSFACDFTQQLLGGLRASSASRTLCTGLYALCEPVVAHRSIFPCCFSC